MLRENTRGCGENENAQVVVISAAIESEIAVLESAEDRDAFLSDLGLTESGLNRLIRAAYSLLNLRTYRRCKRSSRLDHSQRR